LAGKDRRRMPVRRCISENDARYFLKLAGKYHRTLRLPVRDREDNVQTAVTNTLRVLARYSGPVPILAVAAKKLRWEIAECAKTWQRQQGRGLNIVPQNELHVESIADRRDPFEAVDSKDLVDVLLSRISNLKHRYALELIAAGMPRKHVARMIGISESGIALVIHGKFRPLARELLGEEVVA